MKTIEIDKDFLSDEIADIAINLRDTDIINHIVFYNDDAIEVIGSVNYVRCTTIYIDSIKVCTENEEYEMVFDDLFIDQCISKLDALIKN